MTHLQLAASKVDASSGCLASDCSALRAGFGIPEMNSVYLLSSLTT